MRLYASFNNGADNSWLLQVLINGAKPHATIVLPDGDWNFANTILLNKSINIEGSGNTNLSFKPNVGAFLVNGICGLKNMNIFAGGPRAGTSAIRIQAHGIVKLEDLFIKNFGGYGVSISADINSGTNASFCKVDSVQVAECGGGFYTSGGDANQILFSHCDARDCDTWGFNDESFLGDQFVACMCHANHAGHYKATAANNRSTFLGCYGEGDSPPNQLAGNAVWIGGISPNGFILNDRAFTISGKYLSSASFGDTVKINENGFEFPQENQGSFPMRLQRVNGSPFPHWSFNHDMGGNFHEVWAASEGAGATDYMGRKIPFASTGLKTMFIGSKLFAEGKPTDDFGGFEFKFGDTLLNPDYDGENVMQWVFKKPGWTEIK